MDPDLAITIAFVCEVLLFALVFAFYVVHEAHKAHAEHATAPERRTRQKEIS
jgi:hypothetical protein